MYGESKHRAFCDTGLNGQYKTAYEFARESHLLGQTNLQHPLFPSVFHPVALAEECQKLKLPDFAVRAAILHDVVEATPLGFSHLERFFEHETIDLLFDLSFATRTEDGRLDMPAYQRQLAQANATVQTLKVLDVISTTGILGLANPKLARHFAEEASVILQKMDKCPGKLLNRAQFICDWAKRREYEVAVGNFKISSHSMSLAQARC